MARIDSERISSLLEQARKGDRQAFSEIVRIMMNPVAALTYKMTRDKDTALDLAQDAFVAAWENLGDFKGEAKFESWLYRIAANRTLNYLKRESRQVDDTAIGDYASAGNPEKEFQQKQLKQRILDFMEGLPAQQKLAFELRFYKQLSFEDMADVTGKAVGTVKTLYREAVKKLREIAVREGWNR